MTKTSNIKDIYSNIQKQLFYMIPEKWDRIYLYASVTEHSGDIQKDEMFFYYYPKSVLRRKPVNVYEVPNKFNVDEASYLKLADKLYNEIKKLREEIIKIGERPWSNVTISIQNFNFNIEFKYDDLSDPKYTSYDRHLIWRYKYLNVPINSYSKKERQMIEEYLNNEEYLNKNINTYTEGIYEKSSKHVIEYNKEEKKVEQTKEKVENEEEVEEQEIVSQIMMLQLK